MKKLRLPASQEEREARKEQFFTAFQVESDRGCVLVAAAILDELLEAFLRNVMATENDVAKRAIHPLFSTNGPLGSFWAKVQLMYALGFLTKQTYDDLHIIREIRNHFAHHYGSADFDDPEVVGFCERLKTADLAVQVFSRTQNALKRPRNTTDGTTLAAPRRRASDRIKKERLRFTLSVSYVAGSLEACAAAPPEIARQVRNAPL